MLVWWGKTKHSVLIYMLQCLDFGFPVWKPCFLQYIIDEWILIDLSVGICNLRVIVLWWHVSQARRLVPGRERDLRARRRRRRLSFRYLSHFNGRCNICNLVISVNYLWGVQLDFTKVVCQYIIDACDVAACVATVASDPMIFLKTHVRGWSQ